MTWLQMNFDLAREHVEEFEDLLLSIGAHAVTLQDNLDEPVLEPGVGETPLWSHTRVTGLFDADLETDLALAALKNTWQATDFPTYRIEILEDKDWLREWMDSYQPMSFGDRLWIVPSWREAPEPTAVNLLLDPGLAFGTGTHPTTNLCLQWLDKTDVSDHKVLDFGCGSGILAIAALLLGASEAVGVDIDPQAVEASNDNAQRNAIDPSRINVYLPDNAPDYQADTTLANILAGPLAELAPQLIASTKIGGQIVLSGLLEAQAPIIAQAYEPNVKWEPVTTLDGWARLSGTRVQ